MRKKLRKNTRIIPYEVPACRQAGMFYDNSLKLGKKNAPLNHFSLIYPIPPACPRLPAGRGRQVAFRHLPFTLLYKLMEKFTK